MIQCEKCFVSKVATSTKHPDSILKRILCKPLKVLIGVF